MTSDDERAERVARAAAAAIAAGERISYTAQREMRVISGSGGIPMQVPTPWRTRVVAIDDTPRCNNSWGPSPCAMIGYRVGCVCLLSPGHDGPCMCDCGESPSDG